MRAHESGGDHKCSYCCLMGRGHSAVTDQFSSVFGNKRGSGREDPTPPASCPVPVSVFGPDPLSSAGGFKSPDAREQLREMPESLWLLYHRPGQEAPRIVLAAKLCMKQGGEAQRLFGTNPDSFRVAVDTSAFETFLAAEYPALLYANLFS